MVRVLWERVSYPEAVEQSPLEGSVAFLRRKYLDEKIAIHLRSTRVLDALCVRQPLASRCLKKGRVTFL